MDSRLHFSLPEALMISFVSRRYVTSKLLKATKLLVKWFTKLCYSSILSWWLHDFNFISISVSSFKAVFVRVFIRARVRFRLEKSTKLRKLKIMRIPRNLIPIRSVLTTPITSQHVGKVARMQPSSWKWENVKIRFQKWTTWSLYNYTVPTNARGLRRDQGCSWKFSQTQERNGNMIWRHRNILLYYHVY
jgi:hypothetical protein